MKPEKSKINIFLALDYRRYLKDWYADQKQNRRGFSFRFFSMKAGFVSPNFLQRVMEGERNLTEESLDKCVVGLGLNKQESEFFKNLVHYNQAQNHETKNHYYQLLARSRKFSELKPMEKNQYDYYSAWYHPVIRELVVSPEYDGSVQRLVDRIFPKITESQAEKSIELLKSLGFIEKKGKGWAQANPLVTTGPEAGAHIMMNYHQNLLGLAKDLLPQVSFNERDVSALTLGISKGRVGQLKRKIQEFRQDILKMVSEDTKPDDVVLLSIQLLPVTRRNLS